MKNIALLTAFLVCFTWDSYGQLENKQITASSSLNSIPEQIRGRKSYKRIEWFNTQRAWPNETIPVTRYAQEMTNEIRKVRGNSSKHNEDLNWTSLGPKGVQSSHTNCGIASGRVKTMAIHPTDPNTVYIGAACGGIWKTTDGGQSWQDIGHGLESLSFGAIAIDPSNPETIYAGSGESCFLLGIIAFDGKGIFKSTNGGDTWTLISNGIGTVTSFGDLSVSPFNSNLVIGALASGYYYSGNLPNEGIWRSTDAGETWVRTLDVQDAYDIAFHPTDANKVFAAVGSGESTAGFYISTDQGATWIQSNAGLPETSQMHRLQIDVSQSNPDIIYAVIFNVNTMFTKAYKSVNGGSSWEQIAAGTNFGGYLDSWYDQGFYDLCIAVDPENPDLVYIGNVEIHRTINGSTFSPVRPNGGTNNLLSGLAHCDYHKLVFAPSEPDYLYIGCDGGVYKSIDKGYNAVSQNQGLETLQLYRIASHPLNPDIMIGGMQDNGTAMTSDGGQTWKEVRGSDGMECLFNPNPDTIYTSSQNGFFYRSINGGISFITLYNVNGSWTTPLIMHPINHQILYTANKSILKTTNGGGTFQVIASQVSPELVVSLALSTVNPDNMIFASGGTQGPVPGDIVVKVSTDGGYNWTDVTSNIPGEPRWISRVIADPVDENTMYVLRTGFSPGNKVWKTTDLGQTWTNISGDLPDLPTNDLFIDPENTARLYLANDIGVYLTEDGGTTWNYASDGIPFVPCMDFDYLKIDTRAYLRVGTHGRSIYETRMGFGFGTEEPVGSSRQLTVDSYPNPTSGIFNLQFTLYHLQSKGVNLKIYNGQGQEVAVVLDEKLPAGEYTVQWNSEGLPAGIYFYRLSTVNCQPSTGKLVKY